MAKKKEKKNSGNHKILKGKIEITRNGMGFVIVDGHDKDIMVRRNNTGNALNGDTVRVEVSGYQDNNKRAEGVVTEVVARKQNEFTGRVQLQAHYGFFIPDNDKVPVDFFIPLHLLNGAKDGDHALARIVEWKGNSKSPVAEIVNLLTEESMNEKAMQGILTENGFTLTFPESVMEEAGRCNDAIDETALKTRKDFRKTLTFTIDPEDAKDFDDAISIKKQKGGWYQIGVHIADVSYYVQPGSELDKEAFARATSVYLPDRVLPMLPERLSNELCSLRPNEDKYTFSAVFTINAEGHVKESSISRTLIHSDKRYTYEQVQAAIEGGDDEHKDHLLLLNTIAQNLRKERFKKGAINFSSQEVRFKLDESGKPIGIMIKESKASHQLVEEMMLLANKTVAEYVGAKTIKDKPVPFPYRVHDVPDQDKIKVFGMFAARFGVKIDFAETKNIAKSFNEMLEKVHGKPEQHVLEQLGIRTMSKAIYTTENIGHYGLGFEHYCHFTSPIRRYPDILVHRIVQDCLDNAPQPAKTLEAACRHCSDQERRAMEAERAANKYKQVEYMQDFIGEDFDAVISGVATFGFWAETVLHKCEGMVSASDLMVFDNFEYKEAEYALVGRSTGLKFTMGDKVRIRVVAANLERRRIDFAFLELPPLPRTQQHKSPINKSKKRRS